MHKYTQNSTISSSADLRHTYREPDLGMRGLSGFSVQTHRLRRFFGVVLLLLFPLLVGEELHDALKYHSACAIVTRYKMETAPQAE
jgi:hypothetical protein